MPKSSSPTPGKRKIDHYEHTKAKRLNNPPVGLVTPETDRESGKKTYAYDPHLDPTLQWAGKAERMSFEVPTVSLHVHERIDPHTIIEAVRKQNGGNGNGGAPRQLPLFAAPAENPPLREAIEFYKHPHGWSNRLIAGDSLLVMNSLLEKEGLAGQVQMVYIDPPYGIKYGSNFQPFVDRRDVKDGKDEDLTQEPEMIRAFRDTWELGIHSYLAYLRDRLLLIKNLLQESGSCFVQISDENMHLVRCLLDEVFGVENFVSVITFVKTTGATVKYLPGTADYLLWYARKIEQMKYRPLYLPKEIGAQGATNYNRVELPNGQRRYLTNEEKTNLSLLPPGSKIYSLDNLTSQSVGREKGEGAACWFPIIINGQSYRPSYQSRWKTNEEGMANLQRAQRLEATENRVGYIRYLDDFPVFPLNNNWTDVGASFMADKTYVVQTTPKVIQRCLLMTTDPGDLVLDPTCGSGTTAYVAEQWGRRWITCDTSRVAITLAKQRLMTASYDYYELAHPEEGVGSGFKYKTVPHVTLKSIANDEPPAQETLYDQPLPDNKRIRVTGPFTVEAVPAPMVKSLAEIGGEAAAAAEIPADHSVAHTGETLRQAEWRDELFKCGIRGKNGQRILFSRVEPLAGTRWLHADAETRPNDLGADSVRERQAAYQAERAVISFGPEHAALEQRQVALAIEEAQRLVPRPRLIVFAAFQFDPEAAKDIDETEWPGVTLLKVQMNTDLLTDDLKKKRASNESFWLIGQPDVEVVREEWIVDSRGRVVMPLDGFKQLSGLDGLAEIPGLGGRDLPADATAAAGGAVRADRPDAEGGGFDSLEYRRRAIAELHRRVSAGAGHGQGVPGRAGDPTIDRSQADLSDGVGNIPDLGALRGDRQNAQRSNQITALQALTPDHSPLSTDKITALQALTPDHLPLSTRHFCRVFVRGFDYYNTKTGTIESGDPGRIAMWMLDPDYDGRSLFPRQVFFPMAGDNEGWAKIARNLRAEIDEELIEAYRGTISLPFEAGKNGRAAVKIVDDRGIESLKVLEVS